MSPQALGLVLPMPSASPGVTSTLILPNIPTEITICEVSTLTIHLLSFTGHETAPDTLVPPPNGIITMSY